MRRGDLEPPDEREQQPRLVVAPERGRDDGREQVPRLRAPLQAPRRRRRRVAAAPERDLVAQGRRLGAVEAVLERLGLVARGAVQILALEVRVAVEDALLGARALVLARVRARDLGRDGLVVALGRRAAVVAAAAAVVAEAVVVRVVLHLARRLQRRGARQLLVEVAVAGRQRRRRVARAPAAVLHGVAGAVAV